jgi:hypothetical protein
MLTLSEAPLIWLRGEGEINVPMIIVLGASPGATGIAGTDAMPPILKKKQRWEEKT